MMILRNIYLWQGLIGLLFVAVIFTRPPVLSGLLPLLAAAGWVYLTWRLVTRHRERVRAPVVPVPIDRTPAKVPEILGRVEPPSGTKSIDPDEMRAFISAQIIGQDLVGEQIARGIYRRMAQERRGKPVFTALLCGPTGTGKTEMAKSIARFLFGDEKAMFRVDCGNVIGEAGLQTLIGSPKGYAGSGSWGALTSHLRSSPRTVLLFDEIEKAVTSPTAPMAKLLLSLLDEGICTEQSDGSRASAREAIVILTSNAAQEQLGAIYRQFQDRPEELIRSTKDALRDHFAAEFLARVDLVTTFSPLDDEARAKIIALHTHRVAKSYGVEVETVDASFVNEALRLWSTLEGYGTREVIRWIEEATADELIQARDTDRLKVSVSWMEGAIRLDAI